MMRNIVRICAELIATFLWFFFSYTAGKTEIGHLISSEEGEEITRIEINRNDIFDAKIVENGGA